jgi:thioredoxin-like negative regulator of GroEL
MRQIRGSKGYRLKIAAVDCSASRSSNEDPCEDVRDRSKPVVALYSFGLKAKKVPPTVYGKVSGAGSILSNLVRDMEPLHLHVVSAQSWREKVVDAMEKKNKRWIVLFNAGQWCPPCTHIREPWRQMTRIIQNNPSVASKLSVALVECDVDRLLCDQQGIQNYPSVFFYAKGRDRVPYGGNRDAQSMSSWAIDSIDNRLQRLDFRTLQMRVQQGQTIVVSFTAGQWCPPCTHLGGIYKQVANALPHLTVTETNCDEEQWTCNHFGIQGYPTIVLFHRGRRLTFESNTRTKEGIVKWIQDQTRS